MDPIQETQTIQTKYLLISSVVLFGVNILFDRFFYQHGVSFTDGIFLFHFWALKICMTIFLVCCGLSYHFGMKIFVGNFISYIFTEAGLGQTQNIQIMQFFIEVISGFIVTWITFPIWLTIRDCTIGCFLSRNCKSCITSLYLEISDLICNTPTSKKYSSALLPLCEEILYSLPIIIFTLIVIGFTISIYLKYSRRMMTESGTIPVSEISSDIIVTSELYRHPGTFKPEHIRLSLPVQHIQPTSSHVLAD